MKSLPLFFAILSLPTLARAQDDIPLILPGERRAVDEQTAEFNNALAPVLQTAAKSTVRVWGGMRRLAYGTVVGDGKQIVTKWSEISRTPGDIRVEGAEQELRAVTVTGVYPNEDIAVLTIEGEPLVPVEWSFKPPVLGSFLAAVQPDGRPAAFGVVSVLERNLRDSEQSYLGITSAPGFKEKGVKINEVEPKSPAAIAGLKAGDIILRVGERTITGLLELKNALTGLQPGTTLRVLAKVNQVEKTFDVVLGKRPNFPQPMMGDRLQQMERMGGDISQVRDSFSRAIQTDMRPVPNQIGGPVVDLKGHVIGITVARADRTRSFVMPGAAVVDLLKSAPENPALVKNQEEEEKSRMVIQQEQRQGKAPSRDAFPREDRMRRHLSDMQRLMERMQEEMNALDER